MEAKETLETSCIPVGQQETIKEMNETETPVLQLWIIQELSIDEPAFWFIEAGIAILKRRLDGC